MYIKKLLKLTEACFPSPKLKRQIRDPNRSSDEGFHIHFLNKNKSRNLHGCNILFLTIRLERGSLSFLKCFCLGLFFSNYSYNSLYIFHFHCIAMLQWRFAAFSVYLSLYMEWKANYERHAWTTLWVEEWRCDPFTSRAALWLDITFISHRKSCRPGELSDN